MHWEFAKTIKTSRPQEFDLLSTKTREEQANI
jgi:hypothetical protein